MRKIILKSLKSLTYKVLAKQRPGIVTITGSIGKTSTKEGIYYALKDLGNVRRSLKNYNNEMGVPFTVSLWQGKAPGKNIFRWKIVFLRLIYYSIFKSKNYPKWLVLEIGSDKPGDLQYLMEMIPQGLLKIAVLTAVFEVHLEFFKTLEAVYQEKTTPFKYVAKEGLILVNADNCDSARTKQEFNGQAKVLSYGFEKPSDVVACDFKVGESGLNFKIKAREGHYQFILKQAISAYQCYPILAGLACALELGVKPEQCLQSLAQKPPMQGRMHLIRGIKNSLIIDDTYNSSPEAAKYALKALVDLPGYSRKIAVLGDMLELGSASPKLHQEVGETAKNLGIDYVFTYGKEAREIIPSKKHFASHEEASNYLKDFITEKDAVLIKGSQGARMEKIVKAVMAQPEKAKELLVRQSEEWV